MRFASYGYSGFFDVVKVQDQQLEALYRFDLALTQKVEELEHHARELKNRMTTAQELKATAAQLETALDEFNRNFDERTRTINEFGESGDTPGNAPGPLFGVQ